MSAEPNRFRRNALASVAAAALMATGAASVTFVQPTTPAIAQALPKTPIEAPEHPPGSFANVVDKVKPGVVAVKVKLEDTSSSDDDDGPGGMQNTPPQLREFLKRFGQNGQGGPGSQKPQRPGQRGGMGSGFIISADGYVVTNNHVVDKAKTVQVTLDDNRTLDAKVIGKDPKTDLALLKITEGGTFPYVSLGKTAPRVGDWVVAIGNPFGLGGTVTAGIVSARGRDIGAGPYDDFLQIDAPINKGNSGGPTFNVGGEVVGVNTAIASPSGGSVGLAFAIPAETVQAVVDQLRADGKVARGYLGVQVHGGMGFIEEAGAAQYMRDARITTIYEGTTGIQANDLMGRKIAREGGATIKAVIGMMQQTQAELAKQQGAEFSAIAAALGRGVDALKLATDYIVANYGSDVRATAVGAVPFLRLMGIVSGGWMMARAALAARARIAAGQDNNGDPFYPAKIATAHFYADHVMAAAAGLAQEVVQGGASALALDEAMF